MTAKCVFLRLLKHYSYNLSTPLSLDLYYKNLKEFSEIENKIITKSSTV